jgi:hypothetical protein
MLEELVHGASLSSVQAWLDEHATIVSPDIKAQLACGIEHASRRGFTEALSAILACPQAHGLSLDAAMGEACGQGHRDCVEVLIPHSSHDTRLHGLAIAASAGQVECLRALLPTTNPKAADSYALTLAALAGRLASVELLLPVSVPRAAHSGALEAAAAEGHLACVNHLLPHSDLTDQECFALDRAAEEGQFECLQALLPHAHPRQHRSMAVMLAATRGHHACADLLLSLSNLEDAAENIIRGDRGALGLAPRRRIPCSAPLVAPPAGSVRDLRSGKPSRGLRQLHQEGVDGEEGSPPPSRPAARL